VIPPNVNVNVNVNLYSIALSHSASNALNAPNTAVTSAFSIGDPKLAMLRSGSRRSLPSAFQMVGPTTANARRPYVSSCIFGTTSGRRLAERRCCRSATWATGVHSSGRYSPGQSKPIQSNPIHSLIQHNMSDSTCSACRYSEYGALQT